MKKIMFNDRFGLTQAVLEGRKTMTRRDEIDCNIQIVNNRICVYSNDGYLLANKPTRYKVGEIVAIAQSYKDCGNIPDCELDEDGYPIMPKKSGFFNKMFVKADLMPHHIEITDIKVERLQDISDEDCMKEGIYRLDSANGNGGIAYSFVGASDKKHIGLYNTPRDAFSALIDKVSGKGTWESNPYVWVYEFELFN
jgi:uncharacterized protein YqfB (UPF0267 family)